MYNLISLNVMRLTVREINLLRNAIIRIIMKAMFTEHRSLYLTPHNRRVEIDDVYTGDIYNDEKPHSQMNEFHDDNNVSQHNILYSHFNCCKSQLPLILYPIKIPEIPSSRVGHMAKNACRTGNIFVIAYFIPPTI